MDDVASGSLERLSLERGDVGVADYLPAYKVSPRVDREAPGTGVFQARLFPDADLARAEREFAAAGASGVEIHDNGINRAWDQVVPLLNDPRESIEVKMWAARTLAKLKRERREASRRAKVEAASRGRADLIETSLVDAAAALAV